jgi:hypothetical protein
MAASAARATRTAKSSASRLAIGSSVVGRVLRPGAADADGPAGNGEPEFLGGRPPDDDDPLHGRLVPRASSEAGPPDSLT